MKKIDTLLIRGFVPPFFVTFFIAVFVLMMQTVWLYIDDIAGKGADLLIISELLLYLSISMFPSALAIATLIASVFVMGNLAEKYELASMKSAGVSLIRIMASLIVLTSGISIFSYFCSNYFAPKSNLKFRSRLYDIRKQKPTLNLTPGIFNYDFQGYTIRIGDKDRDNKSIKSVLIYDNSTSFKDRFSVTTATKGEMYGSDDDRYFVMKLYNGGRSEEGNKNPNDKSYPFVRLKFKKWTKVFDLSQFDLNRTDENLFKNNQAMMKSSELVVAIDSINSEISDRVTRASGIVNEFWKRSNLKLIENNSDKIPTDTLKSMIASNKVNTEVTKNTKDSLKIKENIKNFFKDRKKNSILNIPSSVNPSTQDRISDMFSGSAKQILTQPIEKYHSLLETFSKHDQEIVLGNAINQIHNVETQTEIMQQSIAKIIESKAKHVFQLMGKFTFALACLIFLFIGAPMGAIVRKGGFGYPILVAIIFFMLFVTLNILFQRLAEKNVLNPYLAAAMPSILLICVGAFLTTKAMNDSQLSININIQEKWEKITTLFKKIKKANA